jgi:hypothetical protein
VRESEDLVVAVEVAVAVEFENIPLRVLAKFAALKHPVLALVVEEAIEPGWELLPVQLCTVLDLGMTAEGRIVVLNILGVVAEGKSAFHKQEVGMMMLVVVGTGCVEIGETVEERHLKEQKSHHLRLAPHLRA